jgi:hypothetical protein
VSGAGTEISLAVMAYNLKRMANVHGTTKLMEASAESLNGARAILTPKAEES